MRILVLLSSRSRRIRLPESIRSIAIEHEWYVEIIQGALSPNRRESIIKSFQSFDGLIIDGGLGQPFFFVMAGRFISLKKPVVQIVSSVEFLPENVIFDDAEVIVEDFVELSIAHERISRILGDIFSKPREYTEKLPPFDVDKLGVAEYNYVIGRFIKDYYGKRVLESSTSTSLGKLDGVYNKDGKNIIVVRSARRAMPTYIQVGTFLSEIQRLIKRQSRNIDSVHIVNRFDHDASLIYELQRHLKNLEIKSVSKLNISDYVANHLDIYHKYTKNSLDGATNQIVDRLLANLDEANREIQRFNQEMPNLRESIKNEESWRSIAEIAAHKLGNPIFAMEAQIENIELALEANDLRGAFDTINKFKTSFQRTKKILKQFRETVSAYEVKLGVVNFDKLKEDIIDCAQFRQIPIEIEITLTKAHIFDQSKIFECIEEMIGNSCYCNSNTVEVKIKIYEEGDRCIIHYSDNGVGVSPDHKEKIFNFGFTQRDGGSGLGMNNVKKTIQSHSGSIVEIGQHGKGAIFLISLPSKGSVDT